MNEVIWNYKSGGATKRSFAKKHDTLLFYSKSRKYRFLPLREKSYNRGLKPYNFRGVEEFCDDIGWYTMVNMKDVWSIDMVGRTSAERNGYATQKPEALLERIISSCSREGDICADFFAGSGTLGAACQKMGRRWIMCDESRLGTAAQIERMNSRGAVFAVERDAAGDAADLGEQPGAAHCKKAAGYPDSMSDVRGEIAVKAADGMIELTGYRLEADGAACACDFYSSVCEPKSAAKLKRYAQEDGLSLIKFWSVDTAYDGIVHRAENIIPGNRSTGALMCAGSPAGGSDGNKSGIVMRTASVTGYDVLGNRFSKIVETE